MISTFKAELFKLATTRTFWGLALGALGFILLQLAGIYVFLGQAEGFEEMQRQFEGQVGPNLALIGYQSVILLMVAGVICAAGEFRHATADATYLAQPDRLKVLVAKMGAVFAYSVVVMFFIEVVVVLLAPWIIESRSIIEVDLGSKVFPKIAAILVVSGLSGALAVAVGTIIKHQVGAIVATLAWLMAGESLVAAINRDVGKYLLDGATRSIVGVRNALPMWAGWSLMLGYVLAAGVAAFLVMQRRDIA